MTFTSPCYLLLLPLVYLTFYLSPERFRWVVLLVASYAFYATFQAPHLLLLLGLVTIVSYAFGILLGWATDDAMRKGIFWTGAAACVSALTLVRLAPRLLASPDADWPYAGLLLSIGVSFFTLQGISYLADVYLEIQTPERHLGYQALYMAFFPKLLQGPIERAADLLPQLKSKYVFEYDAMRSGLLLFGWGLFKKVALADRFALLADPVFDHVRTYTGLPLLIGTYAYAMQIYFDFAGYTDMARGTARLFGVSLTENFSSPYLAVSVADFWRRWHVSFSRWILDYIFKPLQMAWRDLGQCGSALALIITFLASGIWHGVSWGFVVWGLLHGVYLVTSVYLRHPRKRLHEWLGIQRGGWLTAWRTFVTFHLVCLAWVFFRASSASDALYVVTHCFRGADGVRALLFASGGWEPALLLLGVGTYLGLRSIRVPQEEFFRANLVVRWSVYLLLVVWFKLLSGGSDSFIYSGF